MNQKPLAALLLSLIAAGTYVAVRRPGPLTPAEEAVVRHAPTARPLLEEFDLSRWTPDPAFAGREGPKGLLEWGGAESLANFGWQSDREHAVPAALSGRRVLYNNVATSWGDTGPLWGIRAYNVTGTLRDLELWRVGDWKKGREGHAVYLNVAGSLEVVGLRAVQCGGQALQIVWRGGETRMPAEAWPDEGDMISVRDSSAKDCGAITRGAAVRASWPFSIFATGARVEIAGVTVETELPEFVGDRGERFQSHGALLVGWGDQGRRTPSLVVSGLGGRIVRSDRSEVRLEGVDLVIVRGISLTEVGGDGVCTIDAVGCGAILIEECSVDVRVRVFSRERPWSNPTLERTVRAGGRWSLP